MHPSRHTIESIEAGRQTCDVLASLGGVHDLFESTHYNRLHVLVRTSNLVLGDLQDASFGVSQKRGRIVRFAVALRRVIETSTLLRGATSKLAGRRAGWRAPTAS